MKRLFGLSVALLLGVTLATTMFIPRDANALGGLLFGLPVGLSFDEGALVNRVYVQINNGWLNPSDNFSLAITIHGVNAGDHEHGYQEIPLSSIDVIAVERHTAIVAVDWYTDTLVTSSPEDYTVCVQIFTNGGQLGDTMCKLFGPF